MRKFRYIEEGHGKDSLSDHEREEIVMDFDIDIEDYYVLTVLTKEEWELVMLYEKIKNSDKNRPVLPESITTEWRQRYHPGKSIEEIRAMYKQTQ